MSVHVIRRGINRDVIVRDDADCRVLLKLLKCAAAENGVRGHGFVLMTNHYHMIVTPHDAPSLSAMMKTVGECYTRHYNRKYDRIGTLWTGPFRSILIADETYWLTCLRYIEQNPVRAGMVSAPEDYPWSSYRVHALGEPSDWLVPHDVYLALGATPADRQMAYRAICGVPLSDGELACQRRPEPASAAEPSPNSRLCSLTGSLTGGLT